MPRALKLTITSAAIVLLAIGCGKESSDQGAIRTGEVPDEVVTDFVTSETDSGRVAWTLTAPNANRFNSRMMLLMDTPTIRFFDDFGNLQTTLTAEFGEFYQESRDMLAYGNVVVVSIDGDVLETDSLRYVTAVDKILSDSKVKLTRGNDIITGIGLECDHKLNSVDIKKDVKAIIVEDGGNEDHSSVVPSGSARGSLNG
jgi:LPS export ABC transporter protein LptC